MSHYDRYIESTLAEGEEVQAVHTVLMVTRSTTATRLEPGGRMFTEARRRFARRGGYEGEPGTVAHGIPFRQGGHLLVVTDRRVGLWRGPSQHRTGVLWSVPRDQLAGVERRPRLQFMSRFRLHFSDGSWAALMTFRGRNVRRLAELLGTR
ncbi:MAG TPA: hypothetical protein VHX88_14350 [Solirubrobacteraceae bacterium]|jgi:hypothetical protein|nr:hypothetical protein [Solirubrobacteraceae bacterium]